MGMYKSPIEFIYGQMQAQLEGDVITAVQGYGINVDKDELIRALRFDRDMYYKGYADGKKILWKNWCGAKIAYNGIGIAVLQIVRTDIASPTILK